MKTARSLKVAGGALGALLLCATAFLYWHAYEEARYHGAFARSGSEAEAEARGSLRVSYRPLTDSFRLRDGTALPVPPAWAEQQWEYDVGPTFRRAVRPLPGYNLVLPLSAEASLRAPEWPPWPLAYTVDYDSATSRVMGVSAGPYYRGVGFSFSPDALADTLAVVVYQKRSPEATWRDEDLVPVDTIRWVRVARSPAPEPGAHNPPL